ncbi:MAG: polymorphic toxin type 44 domain-containing protein [bacterium]|nr:polymorphic toxin type 44 domain-containing protein [bacterium]
MSINYQPSTINFGYTYDNVGNRLSLTDTNGIHNYTYDNVYRLANSNNPGEAYNYDPVGNRNPLTQTYDAGNRLLDDGTYTYTYDHDGNMVTKQNKTTLETTTYTYNSEDQLIGVVTPTQAISYKYDALGRRIEKNVAGTITRYIYDGEDIIQELDGNNQIVSTYTHGPGIDEPILVEKNGEKYYYVSDGLGSITALVDQNGNVTKTFRYDSFGNILSTTGSLTQPYTYTGREYDPETGLFYFRARYYDPKIGRFLQEDPIWNRNAYSYCYNNPLILIDPLGLEPPKNIPPGVNLNANVREARNMSPLEFYNAVKSGGKWDYKQKGRQYEDFGNYNYGLTGRATGFSEDVLLRGAGAYQIYRKTSERDWGWPWGGYPYGDDPNDQKWIKEGITDYEKKHRESYDCNKLQIPFRIWVLIL